MAKSIPRPFKRSFVSEQHQRPKRPFSRSIQKTFWICILLSLAVTPDTEFSAAEKANLMAKLKRLPIVELFVDPVSEGCSEAGPITSTVSLNNVEGFGPIWVLFAYGPLNAIIRQWPGAPALRVAASLDKITSVEIDVPRIADSLRAEKGILVLSTNNVEDFANVRAEAADALGQLEEISVSATAGE